MHAELYAALSGLLTAQRVWPTMSGAVVKTDCQAILTHVEQRDPISNRASRDPVLIKLRHDIAALGLNRLYARWVKGHRHPQADVSAYLNVAVDGLARDALRADMKAHQAAGDPNLVAAHNEVRIALVRRFGGAVRDLRAAREWVARQLGAGSRHVKISRLTAAQCVHVLGALAGELRREHEDRVYLEDV